MALVKFVRAWQLLGEMNGKMLAKLDLQVETAEDLPSIGDEINEYIVAAGSNAQIIQSSEPTFVTLSETDAWFPEQSDGTKSLNASLSMSPTLNKAITDSTDDMIDLTEDDIDRISDELEQAEAPVKEQKKEYVESIEEPEKDGEDDDER